MAAENDDTALVMTRELDAPRSLVFEVWTNAEHLEQWFGPNGFKVTATVDFRTGGTSSIRMQGYGMDHTVHSVYREIVPNEKIVQSMRFDDMPEHEIITTVTFTERAGKTTVTVRQQFPQLDALAPAYQELLRPRMRGAKEGWSQTLQHLVEYVAKRSI